MVGKAAFIVEGKKRMQAIAGYFFSPLHLLTGGRSTPNDFRRQRTTAACSRAVDGVVCACVQSRVGTVPDSLAMRCCCFVPRRCRSLSVLCPATYAGVFLFFPLLPAHPIIQSGRWQSGRLCLQCLLGRADVSNDVLLRGRRTCCCKVHV